MYGPTSLARSGAGTTSTKCASLSSPGLCRRACPTSIFARRTIAFGLGAMKTFCGAVLCCGNISKREARFRVSLRNRSSCRFFFPWPKQPHQCYCETSERVALQRRHPADDAFVVPHNLYLTMFSPSSVNVLAFDPTRGSDHARAYASSSTFPRVQSPTERHRTPLFGATEATKYCALAVVRGFGQNNQFKRTAEHLKIQVRSRRSGSSWRRKLPPGCKHG